MGGDVVYRVEVDYAVQGLGDIAPEANHAREAFGQLGMEVTRSQTALERLNAYALGFLGINYLSGQVKGLASEFIHLNQEAESTRIALAGMFQAGRAPGLEKMEDFPKALATAEQMMIKMRKHARDLPGEYSDLMHIFRPVLMPGLQAGKGLMDIEAWSARMMAVSATLQVPSEVAGRELAMILGGRTSSHMPIWQRLRGIIKLDMQKPGEKLSDEDVSKRWHGMDEKARYEEIFKATQPFQPSIDKFSETWDAIASTTSQWKKDLERIAGGAFFGAMKKELDGINQYLQNHELELTKLAEVWGVKIANAFISVASALKSGFGFLVDHKGTLIAIAEVWGALLAKNRLVDMLGFAGGAAAAGNSQSRAAKFANAYLGGNGALDALAISGARESVPMYGTFGRNMAMMRAAVSDGWGGMQGAGGGLSALPSAARLGVKSAIESELRAIEATNWSAKAMLGPAIFSTMLAKLANEDMTLVETGIATLGGALSSLPGPIGMVSTGLTALYLGLQGINGYLKNYQKERNKEGLRADSAAAVLYDYGAGVRSMDPNGGYEIGPHALERLYSRFKAADAGTQAKDDSSLAAEAQRRFAALEIAKRGNSANEMARNLAPDMDWADPQQATMRRMLIKQGLVDNGRVSEGEAEKQAEVLARIAEIKEATKKFATEGPTAPDGTPKGPKAKDINVHVKIEQHIEDADDPDRVAIATRDGFLSALKLPNSTGQSLHAILLRPGM